MRNAVLTIGAVAVLAVGFAFAQGASDGDEGSPTSAGVETTQANAAPATTTPPTETGTSTPATTTQAAPAPEPEIQTIVFAKGKPKGGVQKLNFEKGDEVRFRVRSDVADEIHVHGFDKYADVAPGKTASFRFKAEFDGAYEVEMEGQGIEIASLEVQP